MLDASAVGHYILERGRRGRLSGLIEAPDADLHVPALCDLELCAAIRRALLRGLMRHDRAAEALLDYLDLPLVRHGHRAQLARILTLRENFSVYDACYVALAESLGADFVTADRRLARATTTHTDVPVHSVT